MSNSLITTNSIEDFKFISHPQTSSNNFAISTPIIHNPDSDKKSEPFSNMVLDYIKQMLLEEEEEDIGDKYYMLQSHPNLEATEKPFYDLIGEKYPPQFPPNSTASQFEKGVQEAKKFLPTSDRLVIKSSLKSIHNFHRDESIFERFKRNKQPYEEPAVPPEVLDDILLCAGEKFPKLVKSIREKIQNEAKTKSNYTKKKPKEKLIDINTLLLHCAQTLTNGDIHRANELLKQIRKHSSPHGNSSQRLANYIADGLEARLAGTGSEVYRSQVNKRKTVSDVLKAYQLYLAICPFRKLSYHYANQTILKTIQNAKKVHILDLGIYFGFQWPVFIEMLSSRPGGPPNLRITAIDNPQQGFRPSERIEETGRRLADYADRFGVPFEYNPIAAKFDEVNFDEIGIIEDEILVVNCLFRMHNLADETAIVDCPRDRVLRNIRKLNPAVFVNVVVNGSYGAPFFMTRFREALYYFSAVFDMLDATAPRENEQRYLLERDLYGRFLINVISCEGLERERPETYRQWRVRCLRAGFEQVSLCDDFFKVVKQKMRDYYHKDFSLEEDGMWLLQGWKGRILYGLSAWRP